MKALLIILAVLAIGAVLWFRGDPAPAPLLIDVPDPSRPPIEDLDLNRRT